MAPRWPAPLERLKPVSMAETGGCAVSSEQCGADAALAATPQLRRPRGAGAAKARAGAPRSQPRLAEADAVSEVSTTSSEGAPGAQQSGTVQAWTSVASRKRGKPQAEDLRASSTAKASGLSGSHGKEGSPAQPQSAKVVKAGLSHFQRIEVGIEDDHDFRVVQRLIGPRGKHMQDIVAKSKGAKVWIIGRGSRSWEDDAGPLVVCVGAMSASTFEAAVALVKDLLSRVHEEHRKFRR